MRGYLRSLRASWHHNCMGQGHIPALDFMVNYGATAKFLHIGADGGHENGKKVYGTQPYAIFALSNGNKVPCTHEDIIQMADYVTHGKVTPSARANMRIQLNVALDEFERHRSTWAQMPTAKSTVEGIIPLHSVAKTPYNQPH